MPVIHAGRVKDGKFIPDNKTRFKLEFAKKDGTLLEVTVRKPKKHRSLEQNNFYWGVVVELLKEVVGFNKDEMHDALREKFLSETVEGKKTSVVRIRSTTELSTVEFMDYIAEIQKWAAEYLDCYIPDPERWEE